MPTPVTMPQLGQSVTEVTIGLWIKQVGDHVEKGEALAEVETDKIDAELPSPVAGHITKLLVNAGETVAVGTQIALIEEHTVASGQPPTASFFALPSTGQAPLSVEFNATLSSAPDGNIIKYDWDFGDNNTGSGVTLAHTYNTPGTFTVKLTVTVDSGATDSTSSTITVL